jgi:hypothetical protein
MNADMIVWCEIIFNWLCVPPPMIGVMLTILAVKEVERLPWEKSIVLALLRFMVNEVVQFVFIR